MVRRVALEDTDRYVVTDLGFYRPSEVQLLVGNPAKAHEAQSSIKNKCICFNDIAILNKV
jgi:GDP-D-mannose dehydratase